MATLIGSDTLDDILYGTEDDDSLLGKGGADFLSGGGGNDSLNGGIGFDDDFLIGGAGADTLLGGDGDDFLYGYETNSGSNPLGDDGADELRGGRGNDVLRGNNGHDRLFGDADNDNLRGDAGNDTLDGGSGTDFATYRFDELPLSSGVLFNAARVGRSATLTLDDGQGGVDTLVSIEAVVITGSLFGDTLTGSDGNDQLDDGDDGPLNDLRGIGNDVLRGGSGDDRLIVTGGRDEVRGGEGNDTLFVVAANGLSGGNSTLDGGAGDDVAVFEFNDGILAGGVTFKAGNLASVTSTTSTESRVDKLVGIDRLVVFATDQNDELRGSALDDELWGNDGNDILDGAGGGDVLLGGGGSDVYVVDSIFDAIVEDFFTAGPYDVDRVNASISWTLDSAIEDLLLTGTAAIDGTGNASDNVLTGNAAANTLNGGEGADRMKGGEGNDTYFVDNVGDVVIETSTLATEIDHVRSGVSLALGANIENLTLFGDDAALQGTGNRLANVIVGNRGANTLDGGDGSDTLTGSVGADVFVLGSAVGSDTITDFVSGRDDLRISQAGLRVGDGDTVVEGALTRSAAGGFANSAELVVFTADIAGGITSASAAAAIGSATSAYAVGDTRLFMVDNGSSSALYLFTASNANASVSAAELQLLATLTSAPSLTPADILFGP